jgi:hypothetical protein
MTRALLMRGPRQRRQGRVERGTCRRGMEPRKRPIWVPTRSSHAAGHIVDAGRARRLRTWRGWSPLAGPDTPDPAPGRPGIWTGGVG